MARTWIIFSIATVHLLACTCGPGAWAPACETFHNAKAVFLGTVLDHNDNGSGKFTQWTAYLVRVDETFRGLDPDQNEVFIDPGSFSSCYSGFTIGDQYLFVVGGPLNFAAMSFGKDGNAGKEFPARWRAKKDLKVYASPLCNPTREASRATEDIAWLRSHQTGKTTTKVYGLIVQNHHTFYRPPDPDHETTLPGTRVTLMRKDMQFTTVADAAGRYSFDGIPPGQYELRTSKTPWLPSEPISIDISAGGCAHRDLSMGSNGEVKGVVSDHQGRPARYVRVELVRLLPGGQTSRDYLVWSDTDERGQFHLMRVPSGDFVLGVNIASAPTADEPYKTTYYPGVNVLSDAHRFQLGPHANLSGLTLRLPTPLTSRWIRVRVYWADGTPVRQGARASADQGGYRAAFEWSKSDNVVELKLIEGLEYTIDADWISLAEEPVDDYVTSDPVKLPAGRGPATIDIKLRRTKP